MLAASVVAGMSLESSLGMAATLRVAFGFGMRMVPRRRVSARRQVAMAGRYRGHLDIPRWVSRHRAQDETAGPAGKAL